MTAKDLEYFKQLLLDKRKEVMREMKRIQEAEMEYTAKEAAGDHSAYSFHLADQGTDSNERENNFRYVERDGRFLYHIDQALERIEKGKYGRCETCGREIGKARLEALPHSRLCIECKAKEEETDLKNHHSPVSHNWRGSFEINDDSENDFD